MFCLSMDRLKTSNGVILKQYVQFDTVDFGFIPIIPICKNLFSIPSC